MGFDEGIKAQSVQLIFMRVVAFFSPLPEFTYNLLDISSLIISSEVVLLHGGET